jgi:hypothetical protein
MRCNLDISYIYDNNLLYIYIISEHDVSGLSITVTDYDDVTDVIVYLNGAEVNRAGGSELNSPLILTS